MVHSCCVIGCSRRQGQGVSMHRIPQHPASRRAMWLRKIRRLAPDGRQWQPTSSARVCSLHFNQGKPSNVNNHPDYVPTLYLPGYKGPDTALERYRRAEKRRIDAIEEQTAYIAKEPEVLSTPRLAAEALLELSLLPTNSTSGTQTSELQDISAIIEQSKKITSLKEEVHNLKETVQNLTLENAYLKNKFQESKFTFVNINSDDFVFYTGVSKPLFLWVFSVISSIIHVCHNSLSLHDHLLLVFMKLRLGFSNRYLSKKFLISESVVSKLLNQWIPKMACALKPLIVWTERDVVRSNVPNCFKPSYNKIVSIIDCFEIFTQRASNKTPRAQTWSTYKKHNTIKFLISVTPTGAVNFISTGWGGRISDKQITCESGYLDHIHFGDEILADRGFLISEEVASRGAILRMPSFTRGKSQLSATEVRSSHSISNVRIHVERVIGRMRNFEFIKNPVCLPQVHLLNDAVVVISALHNLNTSIVKD